MWLRKYPQLLVTVGMQGVCVAIKKPGQHLVQSLSTSDVRNLLRRRSCKARSVTSNFDGAVSGRAAVPLM